MQYRALGQTGINVSAVAYGGIVSAGSYDGVTYPADNQQASDRYVAWAMDQGVNYFDVAPSYGNAQAQLGNSLKGRRSQVFLACKTAARTLPRAKEELKESLRQLHTDWFDNYQIHGISSMEEVDVAFGPGGVMEMIRGLKEKGIAAHVGFTAHNEDAALRMMELYDFDTVLFPFNWHMHMAHGMGQRLLDAARERGMGVLCIKSMIDRAWDPGEKDASRYPKSWCRPFDPEGEQALLTAAVKYALSLGVDTIIPPGNFDHFSFGVSHIDELLANPLKDDDLSLLRRHLESVRDRPFFKV